MNKYLVLLQQNWQNGLAYPLSFGLWRLRQLLSTLMSLTIWTVIFNQNQQVFGYDRSQMITYVLIVSILQGAIIATDLNGLSSEIYSGSISQLLIKPLNIFGYLISREVADKGKNLLFLIFESAILIFLFKPTLTIPNPAILGIFLMWLLLGVVINFFIQILFGTLGFWSPETWGPKFLFFVMVDATAGKLFPLDILPSLIQKILFLTPFPYLSYVQSQLFLQRSDPGQTLSTTIGLLFWTFLLGFLAISIWRRGMRDYTASGQ